MFRLKGIQIVITPLNLLGKQNAEGLAKAGIQAIAINSETATSANIAVGNDIFTSKHHADSLSGNTGISLPNCDHQSRAGDEAK